MGSILGQGARHFGPCRPYQITQKLAPSDRIPFRVLDLNRRRVISLASRPVSQHIFLNVNYGYDIKI
jgi:hypothetical protein